MNLGDQQKLICRKYNTDFVPIDLSLKLGISRDFFDGTLPLNGLRSNPDEGTCGWFLWAGGEMSEDEDYFQPMHAIHLIEKKPYN